MDNNVKVANGGVHMRHKIKVSSSDAPCCGVFERIRVAKVKLYVPRVRNT